MRTVLLQRKALISCCSLVAALALLATFGCAVSSNRPTATQSARAAKLQNTKDLSARPLPQEDTATSNSRPANTQRSRDRAARPAPQGVVNAERRQTADAKPVGLGVQVKKAARGIEVVTVLKNSPAEVAGLNTGDIILEINKKPINTPEDLSTLEIVEQSVQKISSSPSRPWLVYISRGDSPYFLSARMTGTNQSPSDVPEIKKEQDTLKTEQIDPTDTSNDPTFGYTRENPVKLGSETLRAGGSYVYLDQLRDEHRKQFKYNRIGSVGQGEDNHIIDYYSLIDSKGLERRIYIDMYHPENTPLDCKAPRGMFIVK